MKPASRNVKLWVGLSAFVVVQAMDAVPDAGAQQVGAALTATHRRRSRAAKEERAAKTASTRSRR